MYEHYSQPVLSRAKWILRLVASMRRALVVIGIALLAGVVGYHVLGQLSWVDSLLEASMILSGMGPVAPLQNDAVKIFASLYALMSGFVLLASASIVMAPVLHRFLHHFHKTSGNNLDH
ncbi:MAG: hypothetical protein HY052_01875 [Proteobacteria bacterium]|nr:hypothetical protein [Pseudomonadota bacterium]